MSCMHYWKALRPHLLMAVAQLGFAIMFFMMQASFNSGLNPHVFIAYRTLVAGLFMLPFAYFLERKMQPKLTWALFLELFFDSMLGVSLTLNLYATSLTCTNPTFLASMINTIAALTFVIAVILRMEKLDVKTQRGLVKVVGVVVSLAGVMVMTLYRGPVIKNMWEGLIHIEGKTAFKEQWLKGSILAIACCISFSMWFIMQARTLKRYPAQLSLATWISLLGGAQSAAFAALVVRDPEAWSIRFDISFWTIIYTGVVVSGLILLIQLWCSEHMGPVFVTMFSPLGTILVALMGYSIMGQNLYSGSLIGGTVIIIGLYLLLWGKDEDHLKKHTDCEDSDVSNFYQLPPDQCIDNQMNKCTSTEWRGDEQQECKFLHV